MPKYRHKMRLQDYLGRKESIDPFSRHLILSGYDDATVAGGLEDFVAAWEETVEWMNRFRATPDLEEYDFDLHQRSVLHGVLGHASREQIALFSERMHRADELFKRLTEECPAPLSDCLAEVANRKIHWWLFRRPK